MTIEDDPTQVGGPPVPVPAPAAEGSRPRRVTPKPDRPLLPPEIEQQFVEVDESSARSYDAMEDVGAQVEALTQAIDDGIVRVELEASESLVHVLKPPQPPAKK